MNLGLQTVREWLQLRVKLGFPVLAGFATGCFGVYRNIHSHGVANPNSLLFWDSGTLTDAAQCVNAGQDPYIVVTFDRLLRPFNYPPIWLEIRHLGVTPHSSTVIGILFAVLSLAGFLMLFRPVTVWGKLAAFLAAASWPVRLAIERGNIDQVVFFTLIAGFLLMNRLPAKWRTASGTVLVTIVTLMKVFPIVAAVALVRDRRTMWKAAGAAGVAAVILWLTAGSRLEQIVANTPQDVILSYGSMPTLVWVESVLPASVAARMAPMKELPTLFSTIFGTFAIVAGCVYWRKFRRIVPPLDFDSALGQMAAASLAIFIFTYLRGSNYGYRLMTLTAVIAWLVSWMEEHRSLDGVVPAVLFTLLVSMSSNHPAIYMPVTFGMFLFSCCWLETSLFERIRVYAPQTMLIELDGSRLAQVG